MKEIWKRWEPKDGLQSKYYIDFIRDDIESGLVIKLSSQDEREKLLSIGMV